MGGTNAKGLQSQSSPRKPVKYAKSQLKISLYLLLQPKQQVKFKIRSSFIHYNLGHFKMEFSWAQAYLSTALPHG